MCLKCVKVSEEMLRRFALFRHLGHLPKSEHRSPVARRFALSPFSSKLVGASRTLDISKVGHALRALSTLSQSLSISKVDVDMSKCVYVLSSGWRAGEDGGELERMEESWRGWRRAGEDGGELERMEESRRGS